MRGHGEKLTRKMEQALAALLVHPTIPEAAQAVGVAESTLWRWLQREDFQTRYKEVRHEAVSRAVARLQQISQKAVDALEEIIGNPDVPASARVSAAKMVVELAVKATEVEDLTERVKRLEEVISG